MAQTQNKGKLLTSVNKGGMETVPEKVKAKLDVTTTTQQVPDDVAADALTATLLDSTVRQEQINERKRTNVSLSSASATFTGKQITRELQNATVTEEFNDLGSLSLNPTAVTISGSIEDLGNGKGFKQQVDALSVLALPEYIAERRDILPPLFYVAVNETTTETTASGNAAAPTLTGNQTRVSDRQLDQFKHRTATTASGTVNNGTTFTSKEWTDKYGGAVIDHVQHKEATSALTVDFRTVAAQSEPLGDGTFFVDERKLPSGDWPIISDYIWDEFALVFIHVTKQIVATGSTTAGLTTGVLTEVRAVDELHELKIISSYASAPGVQTIPASVEIRTPQWFTSGPTQVDTSSGYTADRGTSYDTKNKQGRYAATLTRTFSVSAPSAPAGTYLNFQPISSRVAEGYANSGDQPYCRVLYYDVPDHVAAEPTGTYIYTTQAQFHKLGWVLETLTLAL